MRRSIIGCRARERRQDGFTLLELLLVVAIVGILGAMVMPVYSHYMIQARNGRAIVEIRQLEAQILNYQIDHGRLLDLLEYLNSVPNDPWGHPYQYTLIEGQPLKGVGKISPRKNRNFHPLNNDFDLYSFGADGLSQLVLTSASSHDDIIRADDGAYIGLAKFY